MSTLLGTNIPSLKLPRTLGLALERHMAEAAPLECVGLLFGQADSVTRHVPLENIAATPETRFFADPLAVLRALKLADALGERFLAVYHSHPRGPLRLSEHDVEHAQPGVFQLLLTEGAARAFLVREGVAAAVRLELI